MKTFAYLLIILLTNSLVIYGKKPFVNVTHEPRWIVSHPVDYKQHDLDKDAVDGIIFLQYQNQVCLDEKSVYYKLSFRLTSETGVQNNSRVTVDFDPSYQQLVFHRVDVKRGDRSINQLKAKKINLIQQEDDLDFTYTGEISAVLILDDIRKGDVIEYSYTIKGFNPIFENKYSHLSEIKYFGPIYNYYYRIITPLTRSIYAKSLNTTIVSSITSSDRQKSLEWEGTNLSALPPPDDVPGWFDPYPQIIVSEYKSWKEVNDWGLQLFPFKKAVSNRLMQKIISIKNSYETDEERTLAALRFVQDEIRYMGFETGIHSHQPHSPDAIYRQRYGDCKDKTYLLCTILKELGLEVNPVLLNTEKKKDISNYLPSPNLFDHVVVRVKLKDGFFWLDPTINYQRGPINSIYFPDYQLGLVLSDTTTNLTFIAPNRNSSRQVHEVFTMSDINKPANLVVTTYSTGSFADNARELFLNNSISDVQKNYLKTYSPYFGKIKGDSLTYRDNEKTGIFTTLEYYRIDNLHVKAEHHKPFSFTPFFIKDFLVKPNDQQRSEPISLDYPAHLEEVIEFNFPGKRDFESHQEEVNDSNFNFQLDRDCKGKCMRMRYNYTSHSDFVPPAEITRYVANLDKATEKIKKNEAILAPGDPPLQKNSFLVKFLAVYFVSTLCIFILYFLKKRMATS